MDLSLADARRLADQVRRRRRDELGLRQEDAAQIGGVSLATWRKVEGADPKLTDRTCAAVDRALGWEPGSTEAVVAGHEPKLAASTSRPGSEYSIPDPITGENVWLARAVLADLVADSMFGSAPAPWRHELLTRLYQAGSEAAFVQSVIDDFIAAAAAAGDPADAISHVQHRVQAFISGSELRYASYDLIAAHDGGFEHLEETPAEEIPEN